MKTVTSKTDQACGTCGRSVGYLDFGGKVHVVEGTIVEVGAALVLEPHRCQRGEAREPRVEVREPRAESREASSRLPYWCLCRMLDVLEEAAPLGLTVMEVAQQAFAGRVSASDVWNGLMELRRDDQVAVHGDWDARASRKAFWYALAGKERTDEPL